MRKILDKGGKMQCISGKMQRKSRIAILSLAIQAAALLVTSSSAYSAQAVDYYAVPPFLTSQAPPLVMLVMGKNHKLYYEAYNDASDINQDGTLDVGYKGESEPLTFDANGNGVWDSGDTYLDYNQDGKWTPGIDYYGYFDSYKCYEAVNTGADAANYGESVKTRYDVFEPRSAPVDANGKPIKKCLDAQGNGNYWSGDYLNYLTTSRMDAMRKVLFGGYRAVDTDSETVLRRVYVPHDAHSWGKEYKNTNPPNHATDPGDGYDIREYTPMPLPSVGRRHLFASTTKSPSLDPLLRVLPNSAYRIWNWVAKERPLADQSLETTGGGYYGHPANHNQFNDMITLFANADHLYGTRTVATDPTYNGRIEGTGNPFGPDDHYMTVFKGTITPPSTGNYRFAVNGDDAVEVIIDGVVQVGWYDGHGACTNFSGTCESSHTSSLIPLQAGRTYTIEFRHEEYEGGDSYYLKWQKDGGFGWQIVPATAFSPDGASASTLQQSFYDLALPGASVITDYEVNVKVCDSAFPEKNCQKYPSGTLKPVGLLQKYGEDDKMYFGLMSGSYANNISGGVLRKNISSITDEIDADTGRFDIATNTNGIIGTINKFKIYGFVYAPTINNEYRNEDGGSAWVTTRPMKNHEFPDWGNPTAEIMYETVRYFSGRTLPTAVFDYTNAGSIDNTLGLPKPPWDKLYKDEGGQFERCSDPFMLVISDIYPTFDSDQLPGSYFNPSFDGGEFSSGSAAPDAIDSMNVAALAKKISDTEGAAGNHYIGRQATNDNGSCSPKNVTDLGEVRGLCPEEPTKQGSYYAAAVAYYGAKYDVNPATEGAQRVSTFAVGLSSPLPRIEIPVNVGTVAAPDIKTITMVPFAKSVGGSGINKAEGQFQPTNTIVEFFVEKLTPTTGRFRINFEDVEQAADHDMDAISMYEYEVNGGEVKIKLTSTSAAGGIIQHMGYIISGTDGKDGTYLEVRDFDTDAANDPDYYLDTPPGISPGGAWNDGVALPLVAERTFRPGTTGGATLLDDPLWYAAKWGGMESRDTEDEDSNKNGILDPGEDLNGNGKIDYLADPTPNLTTEWDNDGNGIPDSYFYVANPLKLEEQLTRSFAEMLRRASSGTSASVISSSRSGEGAVYQALFYPEYEDSVGNAVQWAGELKAMLVDDYGRMRTDMYWDPLTSTVKKDAGAGLRQLNFKNEDVNGNGALETCLSEDLNSNGQLDAGEDINHNSKLDLCINEDLDGDGKLDYRDLIVTYDGGTILLWDDSNENGALDVEDEITFSPDILAWHNNGVLDTEDLDGDGYLDPGEDINGNGLLDSEDLNNNGTLDTELVMTGLTPEDINYIWRAQDWLDSWSLDPLAQRASYASTSDLRYIFTFVDQDDDMLVDPGEQIPFVSGAALPTMADLYDKSKVYPYLTLYPSFADKPAWVTSLETAGLKDVFLQNQSKRLIDYIRGQDQSELDITGLTTVTVPAMRKRSYHNDRTGLDQTWRLGDIVSSSPTQVGRPAEGYHLIYRDESYARFLARYQMRRSVIYVGGNDGMIHAFNAGFYDPYDRTFKTAIAEPFIDSIGNDKTYQFGERFTDWNNDGVYTPANQTQFALGAELWAYVPYNLLPHLYWLSETTYPHVFYNDLPPKVFDAKIFFQADGTTPIDADHPDGWGTVMVMGMRFGGGHITADMNRNNLVDVGAAGDREMSSAYVVMDITNPEKEPRVLAELRLPRQGYTTCYPTVIPMRSKRSEDGSAVFDTNDWYLVFGSGPADAAGYAASRDAVGQVATSGTVGESKIIDQGISEQNGRLFVVDLKALAATTPAVLTINPDGVKRDIKDAAATSKFIEEFDGDEASPLDDVPSMISQPVTVDFDLDFNADAVYFGTISGFSSDYWGGVPPADKTLTTGGQLKRLIVNDEMDTTRWVAKQTFPAGVVDIDRADNILLDLAATATSVGQPITAAPSVAVGEAVKWDIDGNGKTDDFDRERWVLFGTGRYIVSADAANVDQQNYYGIKEPYTMPGGSFTWGEVAKTGLLNSTNVKIRDDKSVSGLGSITTWDDMIKAMESSSEGWLGWSINFNAVGERNLGQAALLGGLLTFTTYIPSADICLSEGNSKLHARWYQTGTALPTKVFEENVIHEDGDGIVKKGETEVSAEVDLGVGLALSPSIHTGREKGSVAYVQTSTGDVITLEQKVVGGSKSRKTDWLQRR